MGIQGTIDSIEARQQAAGAQSADPLADHGRSPTEREVLRVLWASPGHHLVRSEIHRRMLQAHQPTLGRVGQILTDLYGDMLLSRVQRRSQGHRRAAFYTLSDQGVELCRELGFEREDKALFQVTEDLLRTYLTPERLARRPSTGGGRIAAFYGVRGGLGRTTMAAHTAHGLALRSRDRKVLAVDLDLSSSGLDDFFAPEGLGRCRGLRGLVVDYLGQFEWRRPTWLREALKREDYVLRPLPDVPNLFYLPSGLTSGQDEDGRTTSERGEALVCLRQEAGLSRLSGRSEHDPDQADFLNELRSALLDEFDKVLVDPQVGRSLGSWIVTQRLADELVLCSRLTDTSTSILEGLQTVLAHFLKSRDESGSPGSALFVFPYSELESKRNPDRWIERHIAAAEEIKPHSYRTAQLDYNVRVAKSPNRWDNTRFYEPLIACLEDADVNRSTMLSPELKALLDVLDPDTPHQRRSMAAGILINSPLQELARWASSYAKDTALHRETDEEGMKLVQSIVNHHLDKLQNMMLGASAVRRSRFHVSGGSPK